MACGPLLIPILENMMQQNKANFQTYKNVEYTPSNTSPLDADPSLFSNELQVRKRILFCTDDKIIENVIEKSKEQASQRFPIRPRSKRLAGKFKEESHVEIISSKLVKKIIDILIQLRAPLKHINKCDACLSNEISYYSLSGNFYCHHCKTYFQKNSKKTFEQGITQLFPLIKEHENLQFNRMVLSDIRDRIFVLKSEINSAPTKEKQVLYHLLDKAISFIKDNDDRFERFFSNRYH